MDEEELFYIYRSKLGRLEEKREAYERRKRQFEQYQEEVHSELVQERAEVEKLLNMWGDCHDSNVILTTFEESVDEEYQDIHNREEEMIEEHRQNQAEVASCESWYEEELKKVQEECLCQE